MRLIFSEVGSKYIAGMRLTYQQVLTYWPSEEQEC